MYLHKVTTARTYMIEPKIRTQKPALGFQCFESSDAFRVVYFNTTLLLRVDQVPPTFGVTLLLALV